jgi:hypothetical protein
MPGPGYKRGGSIKEEAVEGEASMPRADKRARGGRTSGGSPFSTAHSVSDRTGKSSSGHEGE